MNVSATAMAVTMALKGISVRMARSTALRALHRSPSNPEAVRRVNPVASERPCSLSSMAALKPFSWAFQRIPRFAQNTTFRANSCKVKWTAFTFALPPHPQNLRKWIQAQGGSKPIEQ